MKSNRNQKPEDTQMSDDFILEVRAGIEARVRDQLKRHLSINPNGDPRRVVDIQMDQEREKLERLAQRYEEEGNENAADACRSIIEWLSDLAQQLKRR
jgi:hypothetical protein